MVSRFPVGQREGAGQVRPGPAGSFLERPAEPAAARSVQPPEVAVATAEETVWNMVLRLPPNAVRAPIAATETKAAIKPYSIAVAPDSSFAKVRMTFNMICNLLIRGKSQGKID